MYDSNSDYEPDLIDIDPNEELSNMYITMYRIDITSTEVEPNDELWLADEVTVGGSIKGSISPSGDVDAFYFTLNSSEIDLEG